MAGIAECNDVSSGEQNLLVIGTLNAAKDTMHLQFFPGSAPDPKGTYTKCQPLLPSIDSTTGRVTGFYIPLNDSRWSNPSLGYSIDVPSTGTIHYNDQSSMAPNLKVCSIFYVQVTRVTKENPGPAPTPFPPSTGLCE